MGLRWTDTIDIAIDCQKHIQKLIRNGSVLPIYMHGYVHYQTSVMTQINQLKDC